MNRVWRLLCRQAGSRSRKLDSLPIPRTVCEYEHCHTDKEASAHIRYPRRPSRVKKTGKMTFAEWANGAAGIVNTGKGILSTREGFDN